MPSTPDAICLIGTKWGRFLGTELRNIYSGRLLVCGQDPGRTMRLASALKADGCLFGWKAAVDHREVKALILAIPPDIHYAVAMASILSGKHVLVEKPLATNLRDCDALIEAAKEKRVVLATGENIPYRPALIRAKQLLAQIGEPRLFFGTSLSHAGPQNNLDLGILLDFSIHHIRALRILCGEPDTLFAVRCPQAFGQVPVEDNVTVVLSSHSGWQATISSSWQASAGRCPEFVITGSRGAMKIWPDSANLDYYPTRPNTLTRLVSSVRPTWLKARLQSRESQRCRVRLPRHDRMGYRAQLQEFLSAIVLGRPDVSAAEESRRDLEIAIAAQSSVASGKPVRLSSVVALKSSEFGVNGRVSSPGWNPEKASNFKD